jgi:Icc protein
MGHTHYNEIATMAMSSTPPLGQPGQIEEGPPGFSLTVIDGYVVSWKFKPRGPWPLIMDTSPSDHRLITHPESSRHVVRGQINIRARAWDHRDIVSAFCSVDNAPPQPMRPAGKGFWQPAWDSSQVADGLHSIRVAVAADSALAQDEIAILVSQSGQYTAPARQPVNYENNIGAWPERGILGTQLGPNENGTKGPWPSWRGK